MMITSRHPELRVTIFLCSFAMCFAYQAYAQLLCGCSGCVAGGACVFYAADTPTSLDVGSDDEVVPSAEFQIATRWTTTASDSGFTVNGTPKTLTWSLVSDGTIIAGSEGTSGSDLIDMLNRLYGRGPTVEESPWFRLFEESFDRWSELSGLTFVYEPRDRGARIDNTSSPTGTIGAYADIRIGGHSIDGASGSNTLAYNYFPPHGDMVIDTDNEAFYGSRFGDSRRLRNVLMHEIGHGIGFRHLESSDGQFLMEPFISVAFDGPQFDDILAAHRNYGDALEKDGGNDLPSTATPIGSFEPGQLWQIGADADGTRVERTETDFVSIDSFFDEDWFRFSVNSPLSFAALLDPRGPTYQEGAQNGAQSAFDTRRLADLSIELYAETPSGANIAQVAESDISPAGRPELVAGVTLQPGSDYFLRLRQSTNSVQMYSLTLAFAEQMIPEPSAAALVALTLLAASGRRRYR